MSVSYIPSWRKIFLDLIKAFFKKESIKFIFYLVFLLAHSLYIFMSGDFSTRLHMAPKYNYEFFEGKFLCPNISKCGFSSPSKRRMGSHVPRCVKENYTNGAQVSSWMGNRSRRDRHVEDLIDKAIECLDKSTSNK